MGSPQEMFPRSVSKNPEHKPTSSSEYQKEWRPSDKKDLLSNAERLKEGSNSTESMEVNSKELKSSDASDSGHKGDFSSLSNLSQNLHEEAQRMQIGETPSKRTGDSETYLASKSEVKHGQFPIKSPLTTSGHQKPELSEHSAVDSPFDLCPTKAGTAVTLKPSLLVQNRERRNESKRSMEQPNEIVLPSGMVLLKRSISLSDQVLLLPLTVSVITNHPPLIGVDCLCFFSFLSLGVDQYYESVTFKHIFFIKPLIGVDYLCFWSFLSLGVLSIL